MASSTSPVIPVLREVSHGNAIFFSPHDENELAEKIRAFQNGQFDVKAMSVKGREISKMHYSKQVYLKKLLAIYSETIAGK